MTRALVLNGPNLNMLGTREPEIYGTTTIAELESMCRRWGAALDVGVDCRQSNHEGALIDWIHDAIGRVDAIVLNPGALAHYSYSLRDAIASVPMPVWEVHISDTDAREEWRRTSVIADVCRDRIGGMGLDGYRLALEAISEL